jgi:hypothetical protein
MEGNEVSTGIIREEKEAHKGVFWVHREPYGLIPLPWVLLPPKKSMSRLHPANNRARGVIVQHLLACRGLEFHKKTSADEPSGFPP